MNVAPLRPEHLDEVLGISSRVAFGASWNRDSLRSELQEAMSIALFDKKGFPLAFLFYRLSGADIEVTWLATRPENARQGLQRRLFQAINAKGQELGINRILLEVRADNHPALGLYSSLGFSPVRVRKAYYSDGVDALVLGQSIQVLLD